MDKFTQAEVDLIKGIIANAVRIDPTQPDAQETWDRIQSVLRKLEANKEVSKETPKVASAS